MALTLTTLPQPRAGQESELLRQVLEENPELSNLELAEIYLIRLRQEGHAKGVDLSEAAQAFAEAKAARRAGSRELSSSSNPSVEELMLVREWADAAGGVAQLRAKVREVEELAERVGGLARLKVCLSALERLIGNE